MAADMLMRRTPTGRGSQGMALLIVLWAIGILALISAVFTTTTRTETNRTRNLVENAKAEGLADAGIYRAVAALLEADPSRRPLADGTTYRWKFAEAEVLISIQSEAGKIDINAASDQILEGLFLSVGAEQDKARSLVEAIRDFTDQDDLPHLFGAEDADYHAAGLADGAKDGPFDGVAELQQVLGIDPDLYETVAPILTVYSGGRSVDPSTASPAALLALPGATQPQIAAIMAARGSGRVDQAAETGTRRDALQMLDEFTNEDESASGPVVRQRYHPVFAIAATAETPGGAIFERVAIVRLTSDPFRPFVFHEWRQAGAPSDTANNEADGS